MNSPNNKSSITNKFDLESNGYPGSPTDLNEIRVPTFSEYYAKRKLPGPDLGMMMEDERVEPPILFEGIPISAVPASLKAFAEKHRSTNHPDSPGLKTYTYANTLDRDIPNLERNSCFSKPGKDQDCSVDSGSGVQGVSRNFVPDSHSQTATGHHGTVHKPKQQTISSTPMRNPVLHVNAIHKHSIESQSTSGKDSINTAHAPVIHNRDHTRSSRIYDEGDEKSIEQDSVELEDQMKRVTSEIVKLREILNKTKLAPNRSKAAETS